MKTTHAFLLGIDLEDVRSFVVDGFRYRERVPEMTQRYLEFFERQHCTVTFFTVGEVARRYPALVREIAAAGHEIANHTDTHRALDQHTPESFRRELEATHRTFEAAGVPRPIGFRAPTLSLTAQTQWVYEVLREEGYVYSSSVLPAKSPLYGWPGFPAAPQRREGVWEIPVSLHARLRVPFAAGVYLRVLPKALIVHAARATLNRQEPIVGYLHPYDIDTEQEYFMHPVITSAFQNWLMFWNRGGVFSKLDAVCRLGAPMVTYSSYVRGMSERERC